MSTPEKTLVDTDPFRHALRRYIAEAPSGFVALGARDGAWTPTVSLPGAISCRGGGPSDSPFIECVLSSSKVRSDADANFAETVDHVEAIVPAWKKEDISQFDMSRIFFANGPAMSETTASVDVAIVQLGDDYNVNLVVQSWNPESEPRP
jgi:hypothetical protein